jgi:hypothetical protein
MEPSPTAHGPQALLFEGLGVGRMVSLVTPFSMAFGRFAQAGAGATRPQSPTPPTRPPREEAWHSYAVYSGALGLHHYKSSRRLP